MDHKQFFQSLKSAPPAPCYVLEGAEEFVKRSALEALRASVLKGGMADMNESRLNDPPADEIIAAAETLPLMAERRLVLVRESGMLSGKASGYDEAQSAKTLSEYFQNPAPTACVVFYVRDKADARKRLYTALKKTAVIARFDPLGESETTRWIAQTLARAGKRISAAACSRLIFTAGANLTLLSGEIEKLIAYAGGEEEITGDMIDAVCVKTTAYRVYDLSGALLRGDANTAFTLCRALLRDGEEPLMLLSLLAGECRRMLAVNLLRGKGLQPDAIAQRIGAPPFAVRQTVPLALQYDAGRLRRMAFLCMDTEYQVKSGQLPLSGALEKTMLQLLEIRLEGKK